MGGIVASEVMSKLIGVQLPFPPYFVFYMIVCDLFLVCFCLWQIGRIRKANVKNLD